MRPLLILGWLALIALCFLDLLIEASRHQPWKVAVMVFALLLLFELRDTITRERP